MHVSGMYKRLPRMDKDLFNDDAAVVWPVFFGSRPNSAPGLDVYSVPRPAFLIDSINSSGVGRGIEQIRIDAPPRVGWGSRVRLADQLTIVSDFV